jgi:NADH-quinone oxidoreductase subunit B/C/D
MDIIELITGGCLHSSWFRIGGVAACLPEGWKEAVDAFTKIFPARIREYEKLVNKDPIVKARTVGIGVMPKQEAIEGGVTGPNLRASGVEMRIRGPDFANLQAIPRQAIGRPIADFQAIPGSMDFIMPDCDR